MVSMLLCFCPGHPEGNGPVTGLHDLRRPSVGRPRRCHSSEESRDPIPPQISANSFRATLFCFANFSHVLVSPFFYECVPYRRNGGGVGRGVCLSNAAVVASSGLQQCSASTGAVCNFFQTTCCGDIRRWMPRREQFTQQIKDFFHAMDQDGRLAGTMSTHPAEIMLK